MPTSDVRSAPAAPTSLVEAPLRCRKKDEAAESAIARVARAVTQPGGIDIDWKKVRAAGAVIAGLSVILGVRHRRWRYAHTAGVVLGIAAATAARLKDRYGRASEDK